MAPYTLSFDISVANVSDGEIDQSPLCLVAHGMNGDPLSLDTIDEALIQGVLSAGEMAEGFAEFTSENADIYPGAIVKISADCPVERCSVLQAGL